MLEAFKQLKNALAYATFKDPEIKTAAVGLITEMDIELTGEQYEPGTAIEEKIVELETALNNTDTAIEDASLHSEQAKADDDDEDDPFAGLGDEDEDDEEKK